MDKQTYILRLVGCNPLFLLLSILTLLLSSVYQTVAQSGGFSNGSYSLPPSINKAYKFAGAKIPLDKHDAQSRVLEQLNYLLMDQRAILINTLQKNDEYGPMMTKILKDEKTPTDLIYIAAILGRFDPRNKAKTGGIGWWALGPIKDKNGEQWVSDADWDDRRDPLISTKIAASILQNLRSRKDITDWLFAASAYVDGIDKVEAVIDKAKGFDYWQVVMPHLSEVFIPQLVAMKIIDENRDFYNLPKPKKVLFTYDSLDKLKVLKDIPLHVVAEWLKIPARVLWEMNPAVDPTLGVLPAKDRKTPTANFIRVPKGTGAEIRKLLVKNGFVAN